MHGQRGRPPSAPPPHSPRLAPALRSVARARGHAAATRPSASARITGVFGRRLSLAAGAQRAGRVVSCISADKGACGPGGVVPRLSVRTTLCRRPWGYAPGVGAPGDVFASPAVGTPVTQGSRRPRRSAMITRGQQPTLRARHLASGSPAPLRSRPRHGQAIATAEIVADTQEPATPPQEIAADTQAAAAATSDPSHATEDSPPSL